MIDIPMRYGVPLDKKTLSSINKNKQESTTHNTINNINNITSNVGIRQENNRSTLPVHSVSSPTNINTASPMKIPTLTNVVQKGQKIPLSGISSTSHIKACFGWNTLNNKCDVDVSAFLLNSLSKVIGDDWFVFYGQTESPDGSTSFRIDDTHVDREVISIDFSKLNSAVSKIVFVLTINEALTNNLNFSMLNNAYVRIINLMNNSEIVSFKMTDYYSNVTSMMIGEIYLHNGNWKFNAIGNGVARDLAGLCELYGVQTI